MHTRERDREGERLNLLEDEDPDPKHLERGTDRQRREKPQDGRWSSTDKPE